MTIAVITVGVDDRMLVGTRQRTGYELVPTEYACVKMWPTLNKISFGCCYRQVFEVVVEGAAGDVVGEGRVGLFRGVLLDV